MHKPSSLRWRLLWNLALLLVVLMLASSLSAWFNGREAADTAYDRTLLASARTIAAATSRTVPATSRAWSSFCEARSPDVGPVHPGIVDGDRERHADHGRDDPEADDPQGRSAEGSPNNMKWKLQRFMMLFRSYSSPRKWLASIRRDTLRNPCSLVQALSNPRNASRVAGEVASRRTP